MARRRLYVASKRKRARIPKGAVLIYDDIEEIKARKGKGSNWPNERFVHKFTTRGSKIYGLPDGSLLIRGKKELWDIFEYDE
ncbi:MAG: hypothetical protein QW514_10380 [Thermoprotei archaeon]